MLIVRSPVRISFAGGGTDLPAYYEQFGGEVLSVAINKYFYTVLTHREDDKIQVISADLRCVETWADIVRMELGPSDLQLPLAALKLARFSSPVNLFLASEIPPGTGLGSSASVAVAVLLALATYRGQTFSRYELAEQAFQVSRDLLAKPVGKQDEYAAAFGGLNRVEFHPGGGTAVHRLDLPPAVLRQLEDSLLLFYTGASHDSWKILKHQESVTQRAEGTAIEALHQIRSLVRASVEALEEGELDRFGRLLHEGWLAKRSLSSEISNRSIDDYYSLALRSGALGGKITGAGGGGFLLLYGPPAAKAAVREALAAAGLREMTFRFDYRGASVLVNDPFLDSDHQAGQRWTFTPIGDLARSEALG